MSTHDHHQPQYHVRPQRGWVNDPNGPVMHNGVLHLFFQSRPELLLSTPVEWGHATSTDWVNWDVHPSAMTPDVHPYAVDGVYSGVTVSTPGGLRAFFSGNREGHPFQTVLTALSHDDGSTFGEATVAVDEPTDDDGIIEYRDPFVYEANGQWHMAVGASTKERRGIVLHYVSDDLKQWQRAPNLLTAETSDSPWGWMWECPQIITSTDEPLAVFSVMDDAVAEFGPTLAVPIDGGTRPAAPQIVDHGAAFYAPSVMNRGSESSVLWGWVTETRAEDWWVQAGWAGALTLPRTVRFVDGRLWFEPLDELVGLRDQPLEADTETAKLSLPSRQIELLWSLLDESASRLVVELSAEEHFSIIASREHQVLTVDTRAASTDDRARGGVYEIPLDPDGSEVRLLLDGSIVEVFTDTGRAATFRIYPNAEAHWTAQVDQGIVSGWALRRSVTDAHEPVTMGGATTR